MPIAGQFTQRSPGEMRTFSVDFAGDLATGDTILSATTALVSSTDPNASTLLIGTPQILTGSGGLSTVVSQQIGKNASNTAGFLSGATYAWQIAATSADGDTPIIWTAYILVGSI